MNEIILQSEKENDSYLQATFLPDCGMNLISCKKINKKREIEIIDQSTKELFQERFAGLGALIGPHFHRKKKEIQPILPDESLFPHVARVRSKGVTDPFTHGIARYVPWKYQLSNQKLKGKITGKDTWYDVPLSVLEGQNFTMYFEAELLGSNRIKIGLSIVSDSDSLVGLHYYYALKEGKGKVYSKIRPYYLLEGKKVFLPKEWNYSDNHTLEWNLNNEADFTFHPFPNPLQGNIRLETASHAIEILYNSNCQENSWQLYHPKGASFVCIEPISAQDPRYPNLSVSQIEVVITIMENL